MCDSSFTDETAMKISLRQVNHESRDGRVRTITLKCYVVLNKYGSHKRLVPRVFKIRSLANGYDENVFIGL